MIGYFKNHPSKRLLNLLTLLVLVQFLFLLTTSCADKKQGIKSRGKKTGAGKEIYDVLLVKSKSSLEFFGWRGQREFEGAVDALNYLGVNFAIIEEKELQKEEIPCKILILPNTRCMKKESVEGIKKFVNNGGKLLATYMSGYRNQDNKKWHRGNKNNFILSDVYGVDFESWIQGAPRCEYIQTIDKKKIQLGRNQAMLVKPHPQTKVLAVWLLSDRTPQMNGGKTMPAVTYNPVKGVIYCGEDLFAPTNSSSAEVLAYIGKLLEKLQPGVVTRKISGLEGWIPPTLEVPEEILNSVKPGGREITVGFKGSLEEATVNCPQRAEFTSGGKFYAVTKTTDGETYEKEIESFPASPDMLYKLRAVSVVGKTPYLAVYTRQGNLVARSYGGLKFKSVDEHKIVNLLQINPNGTYNFEVFRGYLEFFPGEKGKILVNNVLSMNEYLAGVVPSEMPATYPPEALKAMAVISRTFASKLIDQKKHAEDGYDVCNTIHCQVYKGVIQERVETNRAVSSTAGIVAVYNGQLAFTPFCAVCGGHTASSDSSWSNYLPYLAGVFDGPGKLEKDLSDEEQFRDFINDPPECYCEESGRFRWVKEYALEELTPMIEESVGKLTGRNRPIKIGKLYSIKINKRSADGRALEMVIVSSEGTYVVEKDKIRWITSGGKISTAGLPSTLFYVEKDEEKNTFRFVGGGWGHGVGMCQEGARRMAEEGKKFDQIIMHYYTGVNIEEN